MNSSTSDSADEDGRIAAAAAAAAAAPDDSMTSKPPSQKFSLEQEETERQTHTVDEMLDAQRDLHGFVTGPDHTHKGSPQEVAHRPATAMVHEDPIATASDLEALETALRTLSTETKRPYLEACVRCPAELTPERKRAFLETDRLDPVAAAERLLTHWSVRESTFGPELAYLPMTLAGAMRNDVDVLIRHCPLQRLPMGDLHGRQMTFYDSGRRNHEVCSKEQEVRIRHKKAYMYFCLFCVRGCMDRC